MKSRNFIMLAVAAVVLAAAWKITHNKAPTHELARQPLYPGLIDRINDAATLQVRTRDKKVTIERDGDRWVVREYDNYPAEFATVKQALVQLASLEMVETKTAKPDNYPKLNVEDITSPQANSKAVDVKSADGSSLVSLLVGKLRQTKSPTAPPGHYVRRTGEANAYLVEGELGLGNTANDWIDTSVVNLPVERVRQVTVQPADSPPITVSKASPEVQLYTLANVPAGFEVRARATVSSIGGMLLDAKLERVIAASKLAGQVPTAVATVETFDGLVGTVKRYTYDNAGYLTFEFATQAPTTAAPAATAAAGPPVGNDAAPAGGKDPAAEKPSTEGSATQPPSPLKSTAEVAQEATTLNARLQGWAYLLPDYKTRLLEKKLEDLIKKPEPPAKPAKP
jgi:hypothetical protein